MLSINHIKKIFESWLTKRPNSLRRVKKKLDFDDRKLLEKKNSQKFYLREIDIDKNLSGSAESLSISSSVDVQHSGGNYDGKGDKGSKAEEFSASFVAQTNWTFVEKLLKVSGLVCWLTRKCSEIALQLFFFVNKVKALSEAFKNTRDIQTRPHDFHTNNFEENS